MDLTRGSIVICVLSGDYGKPRPAVVVQSDLFNETHSSVTLCPITTHLVEASLFRLPLSPTVENNLKQPSQIMVDKIMTLHRDQIKQQIGRLNETQKQSLNQAIMLWLELEA